MTLFMVKRFGFYSYSAACYGFPKYFNRQLLVNKWLQEMGEISGAGLVNLIHFKVINI